MMLLELREDKNSFTMHLKSQWVVYHDLLQSNYVIRIMYIKINLPTTSLS